MEDAACSILDRPCSSISLAFGRGYFPRPRRCHMTHTDRQQSDEQVNDSYNPMKISGHERSLSQAEGDHQAADHNRKCGDRPASGREKRLCHSNDPQGADGEKSEQHMER